jgi:predicted nucleotidyltransferase
MKKIFIGLLVCFILTPISFTQQFTEQASIPFTGVWFGSVAWGDYDNDDDLDILLTGLTSDYNIISKVYRNDGNGIFTEQTSISLIGVFFSSVAWGDYNNDGNLDIVLTGNTSIGSSSEVSKIYRNNGNNTFTDQTSILLPGIYQGSAIWGDYDNDGDLDLFLSGQSGNNTVSKIYRNNGSTFIEQTTIPFTGVKNSSAEWGDYDNDGDLDLLLIGATVSTRISKIYRNNGNNSFSEQTAISLIGVSDGEAKWGDYDNDGNLDIVLSGSTGNSAVTKIYRNNGNNTFSEQSLISLAGTYYSSVEWGDYDNDGYLDIFSTGASNNSPFIKSWIYQNNGNNYFSEQTSISRASIFFGDAAWGDYDNDGDLDIIIAGNKGDSIVTTLYRNNNLNQNNSPSPPENLTSFVNGHDVQFQWNKSTDNETAQGGLKYNLVIGTASNEVNTLSPMSNRSNGFRKIIGLGNTNHDTAWTIKGLSNGNYFWSVQALDNSFAGSDFSTEKSFAIFLPLTPNVTLQPVSQTVTQGQTVSFRVEAVCDGPIKFQWWKGETPNQWNNGDKNGRLTIVNTANSSTLTITNVNVDGDNNNLFTCEVKNNNYPAAGSWINSNTVDLTVTSGANVQWARSGNGTATDFGHSITVDKWGCSYIIGTYNGPSINFSGTILNNSGSGYDIFLVKYDFNGNLLWAKTFGSLGREDATEVDVDSLGNVFIGGCFESTSINFDAYSLNNSATNNSADLFMVKLNSSGNVLWAKSAGGNAGEVITGIAVDSLGNSFITGSYASSSITFGNTVLIGTNTDDIFIAKYDVNGNPMWAKNGNGSSSYDWGNGIAVDGSGNCYVIGSFTSQSITVGSYTLINSNINGSSDIFVVKYNPFGNVVWAKKWGSSGNDYGQKIDVSRDGNSYITGAYGSSSINFGTFTLTNANPGLNDIYTVKFDLSANTVWAKSGNGTHDDLPYDIVLDEFENVFVAGSFASDVLNFNFSSLTNSGANITTDIFIVKYDSQGNILWTSKAGGNASDLCETIAAYNSESWFIGGTYKSNNLTFGSTSLSNYGDRDVFIAHSRNIFTTGGIKVIIEGLYNNDLNRLNMRDTVKAYLRNISSPFTIVDSAQAVIDSISFIGNFEFLNAPNGIYYLVIKHRNSIETWSEPGGVQFLQGTLLSYDFTKDSTKAYGSNMVKKGTNWCIYSGDVNQDGLIDGSDDSDVSLASQNGLTGYLTPDLNGDYIIDIDDMSICHKNVLKNIMVLQPTY